MNRYYWLCAAVVLVLFQQGAAQRIGVGVLNPEYQLDVSNRMRIRSGGDANNSAGMWLNNSNNTGLAGFIGVTSGGNIGIFSSGISAFGLIQRGSNGFVGLGTDNPNAPLQFANELRNRKLVLYDANNNDHQYYGLGITSGLFRYQVDASTADHAFFAASGVASSTELLRIKGNGNVGIGQPDPVARLQFRNEINSRMIVLNESERNPHNYFGFGINEFTLRYQVADPLQSHVFFAGNAANATGSNELLRITGSGNVGIGISNPARPLSFPPFLGKKISLYPGSVGDAGFSVWGNELRIHSDNPTAAITFGVDAYNAPQFTERMRITGGGNVGIGIGNPTAPLQFATDTRNRKIVLWSVTDNDHQFYGFGVNAFTLRYQVPATTDDHVFYAGTSENISRELFRIRGNGALGINGNSGTNGQVLVSRGGTSSPVWADAPGRYMQVFQTENIFNLAAGSNALVPGLQATIHLERPSRVALHFRLRLWVLSCFACEPNLSYVNLEKVISNESFQTISSFPTTTPVGKFTTFSSGPVILDLPAGEHIYRISFFNSGPVSQVNVDRGAFAPGQNPSVLAWQIFPN
jgi:hypothetical protein